MENPVLRKTIHPDRLLLFFRVHSAFASACQNRSEANTHSQSGGAANAMRQNALAVGLVSETLTKIGANAIDAAPTKRAATASGLCETSGVDMK